MQAAGRSFSELAKPLEITAQTFYRSPEQYAGMKTPEATRLKDLKSESVSLKRIAGEQALECRFKKGWAAEGNF
jgi:hypothetical protein